jgi:hypothetical protein
LPCITFTMVTAAGMSTGDRIIRKIMNGTNMALPTFLCEGFGWMCCDTC